MTAIQQHLVHDQQKSRWHRDKGRTVVASATAAAMRISEADLGASALACTNKFGVG